MTSRAQGHRRVAARRCPRLLLHRDRGRRGRLPARRPRTPRSARSSRPRCTAARSPRASTRRAGTPSCTRAARRSGSPIDLRCDYLRPALPDPLRITATCLRAGGRSRSPTCAITASGEPDRLIAVGRATFARTVTMFRRRRQFDELIERQLDLFATEHQRRAARDRRGAPALAPRRRRGRRGGVRRRAGPRRVGGRGARADGRRLRA